MTSRTSTAAPILTLVVILLASLLAYFGGYFWLGVRTQGQGKNLAGVPVEYTQRIFHHDWQISIFAPAAWVESAATGHTVTLHRWEEFVSPSLDMSR